MPLAVAEPLKLATLFIVGKGHWIAGVVAMICAYAVSLFVTERLFQIVKPKLLSFAVVQDALDMVHRGPRQGVRLFPAAGP